MFRIKEAGELIPLLKGYLGSMNVCTLNGSRRRSSIMRQQFHEPHGALRISVQLWLQHSAIFYLLYSMRAFIDFAQELGATESTVAVYKPSSTPRDAGRVVRRAIAYCALSLNIAIFDTK